VNSIRRSLLVFIVGGCALVLIAAGSTVQAVAGSVLRRQLDASLTAQAKSLAALVVFETADPEDPADADDEPGLVFDYKGSLTYEALGVLMRIRDEEGEVLAASPEWPRELEHPVGGIEPEDGASVRSEVIPGIGPARVVTLAAYATSEPDEEAGETTGRPTDDVVLVEVAGSTANVDRAVGAVLGALLAGGALAGAGMSVTVWLGVRRALQPLERLRRGLDAIADADDRIREPAANYPVELRPVIGAVEQLLARLRAAMERERRFTDAAAHELRTPIAELRMIADVAERWPEQERLQRGMAEVGAVADEMETLLESLLAVARGEMHRAGGPDEGVEPVQLLSAVRAALRGRTEGLKERDIACEAAGDERAQWTARRGAALAIVRNLIDNACEYTPPGGTVRISARVEGDRHILEIANGPVDLSNEDTERMFEPFWRAEQARSDRSHSGLGLAIVTSLAHALKLKVSARVDPDRTLSIRVASGER